RERLQGTRKSDTQVIHWRPPPRLDPEPPCDDDEFVVEPERFYRSTADWSLTSNHRPIGRPCEMVGPSLVTGIIEGYALAGLWIDAADSIAFEIIAAGAGEPQVLPYSRTTERFGDQVLILQRHPDQHFRVWQ